MCRGVRHPRTLGVRHIALHCANLPGMERFYCDVLGFEVVWRPDEANVYLSSGTDNLALHAGAGELRETRLDHLGIMVPAREDVDAWNEHMQAHGVAVRHAPRDHRDGSRSLYVGDPDGNVVQVLYVPGCGS